MYDNYNYPAGADNESAPWNQIDPPEREVEVTVSITLSKTFKIVVTDYTTTGIEIDDDGHKYEEVSYSDCDLKKAVKDQVYLPQDAGKILQNSEVSALESIADDFLGWTVDDFDVVPE